MKFAYVDESGSQGEGDAFVMVGILIDAYRLRKCTSEFDVLLKDFSSRHPSAPRDFKTKRFINGLGGWSAIPPDDRKNFLKSVVALVNNYSKLYAFSLSFACYQRQLTSAADLPSNMDSYWTVSGMFVSSLIQKKMQNESNNKGLTVLVFDENKVDMPKVSHGLYEASPWFDGIYATPIRRRGAIKWEVKAENRFDQIINTAFAIKSEHSSLVQAADALSYIYRRHLELATHAAEAWTGEKDYYADLFNTLERNREKCGRTQPNSVCVDFYKSIKHPEWEI